SDNWGLAGEEPLFALPADAETFADLSEPSVEAWRSALRAWGQGRGLAAGGNDAAGPEGGGARRRGGGPARLLERVAAARGEGGGGGVAAGRRRPPARRRGPGGRRGGRLRAPPGTRATCIPFRPTIASPPAVS